MSTMIHLKRALKLLAAIPSGVKLSPVFSEHWNINPDFILNSSPKDNPKEHVGRFAYNPKTRELVMGTMHDMHAIIVRQQSSSAFDDFVRGVYDGTMIYLRWYGADPYADPDEIKAQSFDMWYETKQMLERNGLPSGMGVKMGVSTQDLKESIGNWYR